MRLARVSGRIWASLQREDLNGLRFVLVEPENSAGEKTGDEVVAYDGLGAGEDQLVLVVEGEPARHLLPSESPPPIDAAVIALVDKAQRGSEQ